MEKVWKINSIEIIVSEGGYENIAKTVHWRLYGYDGDFETSVYGSINLPFDPETITDFTNYEDLDEDTVLTWVKDSMGEEQVAAYELSIEKQLYDLKHPKIITKPVPWADR